MSVTIRDTIPDLELEAYVGSTPEPKRFRLTDFRGSWVVLFFYPRDFTFICPDRAAGLRRARERIRRRGCRARRREHRQLLEPSSVVRVRSDALRRALSRRRRHVAGNVGCLRASCFRTARRSVRRS